LLLLSGSGLAATAILCFLYSWNDFFFALILTRTEAMTAPVAVVDFMNYEGWEWGKFAAARHHGHAARADLLDPGPQTPRARPHRRRAQGLRLPRSWRAPLGRQRWEITLRSGCRAAMVHESMSLARPVSLDKPRTGPSELLPTVISL
jgi:hypothetical protein